MQSASDFLRDYILEKGIVNITPQQVVKMAEDPENPLHTYFQWNDAAAGHNWRVLQARQLLASIKITVENKPDVEVRMMVSVPTDRGENGYTLLAAAMKNPAARESLKREMTAKVEYWKEQADILDGDTMGWLDAFPVIHGASGGHSVGVQQ